MCKILLFTDNTVKYASICLHLHLCHFYCLAAETLYRLLYRFCSLRIILFLYWLDDCPCKINHELQTGSQIWGYVFHPPSLIKSNQYRAKAYMNVNEPQGLITSHSAALFDASFLPHTSAFCMTTFTGIKDLTFIIILTHSHFVFKAACVSLSIFSRSMNIQRGKKNCAPLWHLLEGSLLKCINKSSSSRWKCAMLWCEW